MLKIVQQLRTALHQLHQREVAAVLQSSHVRSGARRIQEGRNPMDIH